MWCWLIGYIYVELTEPILQPDVGALMHFLLNDRLYIATKISKTVCIWNITNNMDDTSPILNNPKSVWTLQLYAINIMTISLKFNIELFR